MIQITSNITIETNEIQLDFIRSSGPGGDQEEPVGLRVSAISPGSEAILEAAGAWAGVRAGHLELFA